MIDRERLERAGGRLRPPATATQIDELARTLGLALPRAYRELLAASNGLDRPDDGLGVYPTDEAPERNFTYEIPVHLPGWSLIGDNSGGEGFFLDSRWPDPPLWRMGFGDLTVEYGELLGSSLEAWIDAGMPTATPEPQGPDLLTSHVDVHLIAKPPGGIPQLLAIKHELTPSQPPADFLAAARNLPVRVFRGVSLARAVWLVRELNAQGRCLEITEADTPATKIPEDVLDRFEDVVESALRLDHHARSAFLLALAQDVFSKYTWAAEVATAAGDAVDAAWSWLEHGQLAGAAIQDRLGRMIELDAAMEDGPARAASTTVGNAVSYVCWRAYSREVALSLVQRPQVPGKVFDMGDHSVGEALDRFQAGGGSAPTARAWLGRVPNNIGEAFVPGLRGNVMRDT